MSDSGYLLLSLMSSFVFRAVRDSVPNTVSQERLVGTVLKVLAIADVGQPTRGLVYYSFDRPLDRSPSMSVRIWLKRSVQLLAVSALSSRVLGCPKKCCGSLVLGTQ